MSFFDFEDLRAYFADSVRSFSEIRRLPTLKQWAGISRVLSKKEAAALLALFLLFLASSVSLGSRIYAANTQRVPAPGGAIVEGVVGFPRFINPVYAEAADADRDLVALIFSGLFTYNAKGELVEDLAKSFSVEDGGKSILVLLKENATWHDGKPFGADDVVFTIKTLQDPKYKSPVRGNWVGVEVEKIDERTVRFSLRSPYAPFLDRLTVKVIPQHIWKDVPPENFALSPFNLEPVGTGPFKIDRVFQNRAGFITKVELKAFDSYVNSPPFLRRLTFAFFATEEDLLLGAAQRAVSSFALRSTKSIEKIPRATLEHYSFSLPRYFAVFFNLGPESVLADIQKKAFRQALAQSVDVQAIIQTVFQGNADPVSSPLVPSLFGLADPKHGAAYDLAEAASLLESLGYRKEGAAWMKPAQKKTAGIQGVLEQGSRGPEVKKLQECLTKQDDLYPSKKITSVFDAATKDAVIALQERYAKDILAPQGLTKGTGKVAGGTKATLNELCFGASDALPLGLSLSTIDQSPLREVGQEIASQWKAFGIETEVKLFPASEIERDVIKPRNYDLLLFGEILGTTPDLFPYWHSTQKTDPGLNLSEYNNAKVDALLENARKEMDPGKRADLLEKIQNAIVEDVPAIFLYDAHYLYFAPSNLKGIQTGMIADPSKRFSGINEWYVNTKSAWK